MVTSFVLHGGWLTTKEVADLLRVHPKHVYRLLKQGLPARQVGGHWRFSPAEVRDWMARGRPDRPAQLGNKQSQRGTPNQEAALVASGADLVIEALVRQVNSERPCLGLVQADTATALDWLAAGDILAVGVLGDCVSPPGSHLARLHIAYEQLVLAAAPGRTAPQITSVVERRSRLASWALGSDLRSQLDGVLRREGVDPRRAHARALLLDNHADVTSVLQCGRATLGVTTAGWARRCALPFLPLGSRPLSLVVKAESLGHPALIRCWHAVQSVGFADRAFALGGIELTGAGQIHYLTGEITPATVSEPTQRASRESVWVFMLRSRGATSSKPLTELAEALRARGLAVAGFVQSPRRRRGAVASYELRRLFRSERQVIARRRRAKAGGQPAARSFELVPEAFAEARRWLEQDGQAASVLVIDGVGRLEGSGQGHHDALVWAARQRAPKVVVAALRRDQAATIASRLGLASRQLATIDALASRAERAELVDTIASHGLGSP